MINRMMTLRFAKEQQESGMVRATGQGTSLVRENAR